MLKGRDGKDVMLIGFYGATSIGKTTATYLITGRLRTHGLTVVPVMEHARALPFGPEGFDESVFMLQAMKKIAGEVEAAKQFGVDVVLSDRTPWDYATMNQLKYESNDPALIAAMHRMADAWGSRYDQLYYFPTAGTKLADDGFRVQDPPFRAVFDDRMARLTNRLIAEGNDVKVAAGTYRERMEFVYHDMIEVLTGHTRPKRVEEMIKTWLADDERFGEYNVVEVRCFGSNSVTRFHTATDNDDFDVMVVIDGDDAKAIDLYNILQKDRRVLEPNAQCTLDFMVCRADMLPYET